MNKYSVNTLTQKLLNGTHYLLALILAFGWITALPVSVHSLTTAYSQGFESDTDGWRDSENGWYGSVERVGSGENGITSSSGAAHAIMQSDASSAPTSRFDQYRDTWPGTYTATLDVYLDPAWADGSGYEYSVASSNSAGMHLRDFIFHVTKDSSTGELLVAGSNNSADVPRQDLENVNNYSVSEAAWYTMQHIFYDNGGQLAVDLNLLDANGVILFTETRTNAADNISTVVGGNRYAWFTLIELNAGLAVDNHSLVLNEVDTTKPNVNVTSPATGSVNPGAFSIEGTASDSESDIDRVEISVNEISAIGGSHVDNVESGTATYNPASDTFEYDVSGLDNGFYRLRAQAFDQAGNFKRDYNDVQVDTTKPNVNVTSPATGSVNPGAFSIEGTASDSESDIDRVEISVNEISAIGGSHVDNVESGTATYNPASDTFEYDVSGLDNGFYRLRAQAFDQAGNFKRDYNDVQVDTTKPYTQIESPSTGDRLTNSFVLTGQAYDDNSDIDRVEIDITQIDSIGGDHVDTVVKDAVASYDENSDEFTFDVSSLNITDGFYRIKAQGFDDAGNWKYHYVDVEIDSTKPLADVVSPENNDVVPSSFKVTGTASDEQSGVNRVEYTITEITAIGGSYVRTAQTGTANYSSSTEDFEFDAAGLSSGFYRLKVQVFDETGNHKYDYNDVRIDSMNPMINAGSDKTAFGNSTSLNGSSMDETQVTYNWTQVSGPGVVEFIDKSDEDPSVSVNEFGTYTFELTGTDAAGNTGSDQVTVTFVSTDTTNGSNGGNDSNSGINEPTSVDVSTLPPATSNASTVSTQLFANNTSTNGAATTGGSAEDTTQAPTNETDTTDTDNDDSEVAAAEDTNGFNWWWLLLLAAILATLYYYLSRRNEEVEA